MTTGIDVGIVTPHYPDDLKGGGAVSTRLLVRSLSSRDKIDSITVYTFDGGEDRVNRDISLRRFNSPSNTISEIANFNAYYKLKREYSIKDMDVIHSYNMTLHPAVGRLSQELEVPSIATLNSYYFIPNNALDISLDNLYEFYKNISFRTTGKILHHAINGVNKFTALSNPVKEIYTKNLLPNSEINVIPNMLDPQFHTSSKNSSPLDDTKSCNKLLYVGSLRQTKGVRYLVRSLRYLPEEYHLFIAGNGGREQELRALSEKCGLEGMVTFLGQIPYDDVSDLYHSADVFVHPGIWPEPFGRTIIEAMQFGLPVVATNIGGPAEVIPQGQCLCEPENPVDLAETIEDVYPDRNEIGEQNRRHVNEHYSPEVVVPQIIELYEQISE